MATVARRPKPLTPFTVEHFKRYSANLVLDTGDPWEIEDFQLEIVKPILTGVKEVWAILPEGNAKALDLNTPLPTPDGWTTMGDVEVGDWLLGSDGHGVEVVATSEVMLHKDCYCVTFSDGSTIVASGDHLWTAEGAHDRYRPRTLTTRQLVDAGVRMSSGAARWRVSTAARQGAVMDDLPADPYVLGAWLGDGATACGRITNIDPEVWDRVRLAYDVSDDVAELSGRAETRTVYGLQSQLRELGVLRCKRIPEQYMLASIEQRQELMRGLLDTDGTVSGAGQVTFCGSNADLVDDVRSLAWSLGRPCSEPRSWQPKVGKKAWRVTISCDARHALFGLPRKLRRLRHDQMTTEHRRIVSITQVRSVPVKCVQVNAADRLYLAGEAMIPTHNTTLMAGFALYHCDYTRAPWVPIAASSRDQAEIMARQAYEMIRNSPGMLQRFRIYEGYREIRSRRNGGRGVKVYAADAATADGVIPTLAICDEGHRHPDLALYRLWVGKLGKRAAQIVMISTAGEPGGEFEEARDKIRDRATRRKRMSRAHTRYEAPGLVLNEWKVAHAKEVSNMTRVKEANPLSTITVESLEEAYNSLTMDLGGWLRLKCNIPARSSNVAITEIEWDDAEVDDRIPAGAHIDLGMDVAWKHDTFAMQPLYSAEDYLLLGDPEVLTPPGDGSTLHPDEVKVGFERIHKRNPVDTVVIDLERAEDIASWLEDEHHVTIIDRPQGNARAAEDYEDFMEGLRNGLLRHTGNGTLRAHVMHAIARALPNDKRRFDRPSASRGKRKQQQRVIDCLTAAAMVNNYVCNPVEDERDFVGEVEDYRIVSLGTF